MTNCIEIKEIVVGICNRICKTRFQIINNIYACPTKKHVLKFQNSSKSAENRTSRSDYFRKQSNCCFCNNSLAAKKTRYSRLKKKKRASRRDTKSERREPVKMQKEHLSGDHDRRLTISIISS